MLNSRYLSILMLIFISVKIFAIQDQNASIIKLAEQVTWELKNKKFKEISNHVHEDYGLKFSRAYDEPFLITFQKQDLPNFLSDPNQYVWGRKPGIGTELKLTANEYYEKWIYAHDYLSKSSKISVTRDLNDFQIDTISEYIDKPILTVEFEYMGTPEYAYVDEESLLLIFRKISEKFYLVGITRVD